MKSQQARVLAISDDEAQVHEELEQYIGKYAEEQHAALQTDKYTSAEQMLYLGKAFDLAILDIHMRKMSGMQAARMCARIKSFS
ncbi:hypothetical protein LJC56_10840 [Christensenellaceae bacterium OttesenSCG-928-K19]|nr:hypothetical protein [Christensenellaceae bacterium OttesenSCG-928-K19]